MNVRPVTVSGIALVLVPLALQAATFEIFPSGNCSGNLFESAANSLGPGDELVVHEGVYCQTGRRFIQLNGTETQPIVIRGADGEAMPVITRLDAPTEPQSQNGIEIAGSHFTLRGLHFERGDIGLRIMGGTHHVTIEDCEISHTANNAIAMNSGDTDSIDIRRNHIHHTGLLDSAYGTTEGEGMYVGCNNAGCIASNHVIEWNYIHDLRGTSGGGNDGIEVKYGSYGNVIRDNVIHSTDIGTAYPCVFVYGVRDQDIDRPTVVERNAMWHCGEAIQVGADAVIRNNLVLDSMQGITAAGHAQVPQVRNVTIVNNTFAGHSLYVRWGSATNMVFANNAVYNPGGRAFNAVFGTNVVKHNYVEGSGVTIDDDAFFDGGAIDDAFTDPGAMDYWPRPGSVLLDNAGADHVPADDFNDTPRTSPYDVGAYETEGQATNVGWEVQPGFKGATGPLPDAACEIELSQSSYGAGETVVASEFAIRGNAATSVAIEWKVWLRVPGIAPLSYVNVGADGSFILPAGTDAELGPIDVFTVEPGFPRGTYHLSCRVLDPVTGETHAVDDNAFEIQ